MRQTLENFFKALRSSGIDISVAESLDAVQAVRLVGLNQRETLKSALSLCIAKSLEDKERFGECFDDFFSFDQFNAQQDSHPHPIDQSTPLDSELAKMLIEKDHERLAYTLQNAAKAVDITRIWFFTQKGVYINRILKQMGIEGLRAEIVRLEGGGGSGSGQGQALREAMDYLKEEVRDYVEKQLALYGKAETTEMIEEYLKSLKLSNIEERNFAYMHEIVRKMAKRLSSLHARKRKLENRGFLDFRRTFRNNLAYDGLLFETYWKKKTADRPRVMAICDVSRSVRPYSRFLLLFLYSLNEVIADIKSYAFVNQLVEVSSLFETHPIEQAIDKILNDIGFGVTDYGRVLLDIKKDHMEKIDKRTTIIILGDGRNNNGNPQTPVMKRLYQKSKRILWLNPEPKTFWHTGDSEMKQYAPYCNIVRECNTIKHLEHMVSNLLRVSTRSA